MSQTITGEDLGPAERAIRYELAALHCRMPDVQEALAGVAPWVGAPEARGKLLGSWVNEHGPLGRVLVLRSFTDAAELLAERERAATSSAPFGAGDHLLDLRMDAFAPFPFVPPVEPGPRGRVYEFRDYRLNPGALPATVEAWRRFLPARHEVHPVVLAMYGIDGPARIVHIWAYNGLDERVAIRADLAEKGLWPPQGAPRLIAEAQSNMAWPTESSPLH
jgi:hypothetical protein